MEMEIRFKKCGISNQPNVCIFDDPCLSKFAENETYVTNDADGKYFHDLPDDHFIAPLDY